MHQRDLFTALEPRLGTSDQQHAHAGAFILELSIRFDAILSLYLVDKTGRDLHSTQEAILGLSGVCSLRLLEILEQVRPTHPDAAGTLPEDRTSKALEPRASKQPAHAEARPGRVHPNFLFQPHASKQPAHAEARPGMVHPNFLFQPGLRADHSTKSAPNSAPQSRSLNTATKLAPFCFLWP